MQVVNGTGVHQDLVAKHVNNAVGGHVLNLHDDVSVGVNDGHILNVVVAVLVDAEVAGVVIMVDEPLPALLLGSESLNIESACEYREFAFL